MARKASKASFLPLVIALVAIGISIGIHFYTKEMAHAFLYHFIAYLLTPLVVALCLAWDSIGQRKGRGNDPWFITNSTYPLILRVLTGLSFIAAFPHIVSMATDIAEIVPM